MSDTERIVSLVCGIIMVCFGLFYGGFQTYRYIQKTEEYELNERDEKPEVIYLILALVTAILFASTGTKWIQEYTLSSPNPSTKAIQVINNSNYPPNRIISVDAGTVKINYENSNIIIRTPYQVYNIPAPDSAIANDPPASSDFNPDSI